MLKNNVIMEKYNQEGLQEITATLANRQQSEIIAKDSYTTKQLQSILKFRKKQEVERLQEKWQAEESRGKKPSTLSPIRVAYVLQEYITFCLFDTKENSRLAFYVVEDGIYTQNEDTMRRVIAYLEPTLNRNRANDVLYHLKNDAVIKEKTISRSLIAVNNGVFNLETKKLEEFNPNYVFTSKIATNYNPHATSPSIDGWEVKSWLRDLANHETDLETLLWQVISSCMNGNYSRKKSIWLYGEGNTGKGTFQQLIMNLVGMENVATLKLPQFSERFALPMLEEKVCVIGDDVPAHVYIDDSSNFNSVVTGDPIMVEQKNKPAYSSSFHMTVLQSTNGLPKIHNKSDGTYRRFLIVQFMTKFNNQTDNWNIKSEYIYNKQVLEYVLKVAINLDFEKFIVPASSARLLEDYKVDNDPIRDFKVSMFDNFKSTRLPVYMVYNYYLDFCEENGYKPVTSRNFSREFENILSDDWEKRNARPGTFFKEQYQPLQFDKPYNKSPRYEDDKTYACYINKRIELLG